MAKLKLNTEEILEIACQIERDGAAFYRRAAALVDSAEVQALLNHLAALEDEHEIIYENWRADPDVLSELLGDPQGDTCRYLDAIGAGRIFTKADEVFARWSANPRIDEVLRYAIDMEMASITFYHGLEELLTNSKKLGKLRGIIKEEQRHAVLLKEALEQYQH